jgi:MFS family permease
MRTFLTVWTGQAISLIGSGLTGFTLGVWIFQRTGSATQYALLTFFTIAPTIFLSPLAGALVDRWDRRRSMILSDLGAGTCSLMIAMLFALHRLDLWEIYLLIGIEASLNAIRWPAYAATTTLLAPKEHLGRVSGMMQAAEALAVVVAPALAVVLLQLIGVTGVLLIDVSSFLFSLTMLLLVRFPRPEVSTTGAAATGSLLAESVFGWRYIAAHRGLLGLLVFMAVANFGLAAVQVLAAPLVLSFSTVATLGVLLSVAGAGMLAGGVAISAWGGPRRRIYAVLGFEIAMGLCIALAGLRPSALLIGVGSFLAATCLPIVTGANQAIWQSIVPPDVQGRVFAVRRTIGLSSFPVAQLVSGPMADYVFRPLLREGGPLSGSAGQVFGVGPGRGIGLMLAVLGSLMAVVGISGWLVRPVREVETDHLSGVQHVASGAARARAR